MKEELKNILDDVETELLNIQTWINRNKMDSNVRYLNYYSVIRASGTIEQVMKSMIYEKLIENASEETKKYLEINILESSANPSIGVISNYLQSLNKNWKQDFDNYLQANNDKKSDLNSLVKLRNTFAHGNSFSIGIDTVIMYYRSGRSILDNLYQIIY